MGYIGSSGPRQGSGGYAPPSVGLVREKAPEAPRLNVSLDPTNPVETIGATVGNVFTGAVGAVKGVADFAGGLPVIGDVGRAIGAGLGAFGEVGIKGIVQVKDVAKTALDVAMLPSKAVQTGAAAVRASGIFGPAPDDIRQMMASGADFGKVVGKLVESNRAFSDNAAANLGLTILTDPLNYLPVTKPFTLARSASRLAGVERTALAEAADVVAASKAGRSVMDFEKATSLTVGGKTARSLGKELVGSRITAEEMAFLDKWRIPASLYDATLGKMGRGFNALVGAIATPIAVAASKSLGQAPKVVLESLDGLGRGDLAGAVAKNYGKGLSNAMVFSISRLFSKSNSSVAASKVDFALKVVGQAKKLVDDGKLAISGEEWAAKRLVEEGVFDSAGAADAIKKVYNVSDAERRMIRRSWIDDLAEAETRRVAANAAGDYKVVQNAGGVRTADTIVEAQAHITEGAYQLERLAPQRLRELFIAKGEAAANIGGREQVARTLTGGATVSSPEVASVFAKIWDTSVSKLPVAEQARFVQTLEIAAYGAQGSNAAIVRSALLAAKVGDAEKLAEILGQRIPTAKFDELKQILNAPENAKYTRINLVKADTITKDRLEAIKSIADDLAAGKKPSAESIAALPGDLASRIAANDKFVKGTATADDLAQIITGYFPDFHLMVGKDTASIWAELGPTIDNMLENGHYVTLASAEEAAQFAAILDNLGVGAGKYASELLSAGRYSLGFAPESNVIKRAATRVTDDSVEYVSDSIAPFLDSTAGLIDESLDLTAESFMRSPLRQLADRWLTPISSRVVQQQQLDNSIRLLEAAGGTNADGRRILAAFNELGLKRGVSPRGLITDSEIARDTLFKHLDAKVADTLIRQNGGDARRVIMKMFAGTTDVVGRTQSFTGFMKVRLPALAILTDYIYPTLKFKLNPNFYLQEAIESPFFNRLRAIDRVMTSGPYEAKYGWAKRLPWVKNELGEAFGLAQRTGQSIEPEFAEFVLGQPGAALRGDLDVSNTVVLLGGKQADVIMSTPAGELVKKGWRQSLSGRFHETLATVMNPYPMKQARRDTMAFQLALDKVSDEIRFKFPRQWTAASKQYGTNDARTVMIQLLRDQRNGYISPIRTINAYRPRNFGFAGPGSVEAATSLRVAAEELLSKVSKITDDAEKIAATRQGAILLKDAAEASAAVGNDVGKIIESLDKMATPKLADSMKAIEGLVNDTKFYEDFARQSVDDFKLVDDAVRKHLDPEIYGGFTREQISSSLARHRSYGLDFPGVEKVVAKLRAGGALTGEDIRVLRLSANTLMDIHGPEEILLGAFKETLKDTADVANRIHFYNPTRNALERTLNHPYLAFYPLSYTVGKIVPEFFRAAFVKLPFTKATRPFAGYNKLQMARDHLAIEMEANTAVADFVLKSDFVFAFKQLFPAIPGDISVGGPRWFNNSVAQYQRSQRAPMPGREQAQFEPFYAARQVFDQAKNQSVWGSAERWAGAGSEIWDFFDGPADFNTGP